MHGWSNIRKSIMVIYHINKVKKLYNNFNRCRKGFNKIQYHLWLKKRILSKLGIEGNIPKLMKSICTKKSSIATLCSEILNAFPLISVKKQRWLPSPLQHCTQGPRHCNKANTKNKQTNQETQVLKELSKITFICCSMIVYLNILTQNNYWIKEISMNAGFKANIENFIY